MSIPSCLFTSQPSTLSLMAAWPTFPRHPRDVKRIADGCANHSLDAVRIQKSIDGLEISAHNEISQIFGMNKKQDGTEGYKRINLKSFLLILGMIFMVIPLNVARAEDNDWQEVRDDFLQGDPELLQFHCDRGKEANKKSISAFNDAWIKNIKTLRFEAGVATNSPDSSNVFFSGLSMAMKSRCPGVW